MKRVKQLNWYQKGILFFLIGMILVFTMLYSLSASKVGYKYKNVILVPHQENGNVVYSGTLYGKSTSFTVSENKTVTFQYGDTIYESYTIKEDATAIPKVDNLGWEMMGIELVQGETVIFRGGLVLNSTDDHRLIYKEDGNIEDSYFDLLIENAEISKNDQVIHSVAPSVYVIIDLMFGPKLTSKTDWIAWLLGVFFCIVTVISILFADELFHWSLSYRIRNADRAEPSDWEIIERYLVWTILTIMILLSFIQGLK